MELHLTVNEKLVGSIPIIPELRNEKAYMEQMKSLLLEKFSELTQLGCVCSFYIAPVMDGF